MTGLVGAVGRRQLASSAFESALALLRHLPTFDCSVLLEEDRLRVGATFRRNAAPTTAREADRGLFVAVYGHPIHCGGVVSARAAWALVEEGGLARLFELDGSYTIAVADSRARRLDIVNDRMGSMPVVHGAVDGLTAFASEAKAVLAITGQRAKTDLEGAIAFVNTGYPVGDRTLFSGIRLLPPASVLSIDLDSGARSVRAYWELQFAPRRRVTSRAAAEELMEVMTQSYRAALADVPDQVHLLLTGGYDSRVLLGLAGREGRLPDAAVTWGVPDPTPASDPAIAARLAERTGVPFTHLVYDTPGIPTHAARWAYISELSSDNAGNFMVAPDALVEAVGEADVTLIGDQMIGPGGMPLDLDDAIQNITRVPRGGLVAPLRDILIGASADEASGLFRGQLAELMSSFRSDDPKDVLDSLYFRLYVCRWLLAPSFFREPAVTARRPLLGNAVVEYTATLPRWLRVDKRPLLGALRHGMPSLAHPSGATSPSIPDLSFAMRHDSGVRNFLLERLTFEALEPTPLGPLLHRGRFTTWVEDFFAAEVAALDRSPTAQRRALELRAALSRSPKVARVTRRAEPIVRRALGWSDTRAHDQAVIWRLALLAELQQQVDGGAFGHAASRQP